MTFKVLGRLQFPLFGWLLLAISTTVLGCDLESSIDKEDPTEEIPADTAKVVVSAECLNARLLGTVTTLNTPSSYVIGAPHGTFDTNTAAIAESVCQSLSWNCVVARGYVVEGVRINVNRPSEGANLSAANEIRSVRSQCVFDYYIQSANSVSVFDKVKLYTEIHGAASIETIEIATVDISLEKAKRIKVILLNALNGAGQAFIDVKIQPVDQIYFGAGASKSFGTLSLLSPVLHMELPRSLRIDQPERSRTFLRMGLAEVAQQEFQ